MIKTVILSATLAILAGAVTNDVAFSQEANGGSTPTAESVANGKQIFANCAICHMIGPDAQNRIGPELNGLNGRRSGTVPGFDYSSANKNSGIVWNETTFKKYINDPMAMVPGTKMTFPGIKDPQKVDDLWTYVSQFDANGNIKK